MTVSDTNSDARIDTMYATPRGANNRPSTPLSANNGRKTRITTAVPKTMAVRTSLLASYTTRNVGRGWAECEFSLSRRKIFSTSTIASSTSSPMATAMPPSVITLMLSSVPVSQPMSLNTTEVMTSDNGMAVSEMNVVRTFSRNRNRTISTSTAPMTSASPTLYTPRSMNPRSW